MDFTEAALELLVKKVNEQLEVSLRELSPQQVAAISSEIHPLNTLLEYRSMRDAFLNQFNNPAPIPTPSLYSDELIKSASKTYDYTKEVKSSLRDFFTAEVKRVMQIKQTVLERIASLDILQTDTKGFSKFLYSVSEYLSQCESSLLQLQISTQQSITKEVLSLEMNARFFKRQRTGFLKSLKRALLRIPLCYQTLVYTNLFESLTEYFKKNIKQEPLPFLPTLEADVDKELVRLAKRFNISTDIESSDGQTFLFHANKVFSEIWGLLGDYEVRECKPMDSPDFSTDYLTHMAIISGINTDYKLQTIFENLSQLKEEELRVKLQDWSNVYNIMVGNQVKGKTYTVEQRRFFIPQHKLIAMGELKFLEMKYLLRSLLSHLNYFEGLRSIMDDPSQSIQFFQSNNFNELINVSDKNGTFIYQTAVTQLDLIVDQICRIGAFYISKHETASVERKKNESKVVDRDTIVTRMLGLELEFQNAKRGLIQVLFEVQTHIKSQETQKIIEKIMVERPILNISLFKSFEEPYRNAIELMTMKAKTLRFLLNAQISQERFLASQVATSIPLMDKPSLIETDLSNASTPETTPTSIFEVYHSLGLIPQFLELVEVVSHDIAESADFRKDKFTVFIQKAVWTVFYQQLLDLPRLGLFPFDRSSFEFKCPLSESVASLFKSQYINNIGSVEELFREMNEGRKIRFAISLRRFLKITWHLQEEMFLTYLLQGVYKSQCEELDISNQTTVMLPFKDTFDQEIIDFQPNLSETSTLEFSLVEFENVSINFFSVTSIKEIIFASDFHLLEKLIRFQRLQNIILEIAVRYNSFLKDSNFFVDYFNLCESTTFLTDFQEKNDDTLKQWIVAQLFLNSSALFRDNQLARQAKDKFILEINATKSHSRTILSAHAKQKKLTDDELLNLYTDEMVDTFSPYLHRIEISRILTLERQIVQSNTFVDTYTVGPLFGSQLINEAGRLEQFFYLPNWTEVFQMLRNAPHSRQGTVLRSLLDFLKARVQILSLLRFECGLSQRVNVSLEMVFNGAFLFESPQLQKIENELHSLDNAQELEIAAKYLNDKHIYFFVRLEYALLSQIQRSYEGTGNDVAPLKRIWSGIHQTLNSVGIHATRYIPSWTTQFLACIPETTRSEYIAQLVYTDAYMRHAIESEKTSTLVSFDQLPFLIDFLNLSVAVVHLKFVYFLLLARTSEKGLDIYSSVSMITRLIYLDGSSNWKDVIESKAIEHLVPKDDNPSRFNPEVPESKNVQSTFDVVRSQLDLLLLSNQISSIQHYEDHIKETLQTLNPQLKPEFKEDLNEQFLDEYRFACESLTKQAFMKLDEMTLERRSHDGSFSTIYDGSGFEDSLHQLSNGFSVFEDTSIFNTNEVWCSKLEEISSIQRENAKQMEIARITGEFVSQRFDRHTDFEKTFGSSTDYLMLNHLKSKWKQLKTELDQKDVTAREEIVKEYETLLNDIQSQIQKTQSQFSSVKRGVYDQVLGKINVAKGVPAMMEEQKTFNRPEARDESKALCEEEQENESLRKQIKIMRALRCLGEKAVSRFFNKRIIVMEGDRRLENAELWDMKLKEGIREQEAEKQLASTHQRLSTVQLEIERLKQQLENERLNNIQLVHWKAKNLKEVSQLKEKLAAFEDVGKVNISELLQQLETAQTELDQLRLETDEIGRTSKAEIMRPLSSIAEIKTKKRQEQINGAAILESTLQVCSSQQRSERRDMAIERLNEENLQLRELNAQLIQQVEEAEIAKQKKSVHAISVMEGTVKAKVPRATSRLIVRPTIPPRSLSRI